MTYFENAYVFLQMHRQDHDERERYAARFRLAYRKPAITLHSRPTRIRRRRHDRL